MHVGPASSSSALAWIGYARSVLDRSDGIVGADALPDEVRDRFGALLGAWEDAARRSDELHWEADVEPDEVEFLAHAFLRIAEALAERAERGGGPSAPPEGDEFYQALVTGIVDALAAEDRARAEFAEQLRQEWPGLADP